MEVALAQSNAVALRVALDDLYAHYVACLDEERFEEWPEFFTDPCIYKIIPRMNFDRGLPLATEIEVRANYAAYETLPDEFTRVFSVGQYRDRIVIIDGQMKFAEKICIFDSELVPNSLIYPL
jgi:salicylate 5-hydroxylase small subunit